MSLQVLILLGSGSDLPITEDGIALLRQLEIGHSLRISSAHRTPALLDGIVRDFEGQGGQVFICVAGMSAHLAGVVASLTLKPVLAVPGFRPETAGFDALLSMGQMPKGVPVSTMSFGKHGFFNACLTAAQIFALTDKKLARLLSDDRETTAKNVVAEDVKHRQDFHV